MIIYRYHTRASRLRAAVVRRLGHVRRRGRFAPSCLYTTIQCNAIQYSIAAPVALGNLRRGAAPAAHTMAVAVLGAVRHNRTPQRSVVFI